MKKEPKHRAKSATKKKRLTSKRARNLAVLLVVGLVVFLLLGGYALIRQAYYSYTVKNIHSNEFGKLEQPLKQFGFKDMAAPSPDCTNQAIYGQSGKQLLCVTTVDTYTEIGKKDDQIAEFTKQAKELDTKLAKNGWETQSNSAKTFEEWIKAVSIGNDFNTDINSTKKSGNTECIIIMTVAYANPKPPAVNTVTSCNAPTYQVTSTGAVISN